MRGGFVLVIVLSFWAVAAVSAGAQAKVARPRPPAPNGEIAVDVTVRSRPRLKAPAITDLAAGTPVRATRAGVAGWKRVTAPARGWIPAETFRAAPRRVGKDSQGAESEVRKRLRKGKRKVTSPGAGEAGDAMPGAAGQPGGGGGGEEDDRSPPDLRPRVSDRSDSDLMLDALTATRGESPNARRIARVVAETTVEAKRKHASLRLPTIWKDPFVDDSDPPPLSVRRPSTRVTAARQLSESGNVQEELLEARQETVRARAEAAAARAEAAALRADAARTSAELARREAQAAQADALAAKREAHAARVGCSEGGVPGRRGALGRGLVWRDGAARERGRTDRVRKPQRRDQAVSAAARARARAARAASAQASGRTRPATPVGTVDQPTETAQSSQPSDVPSIVNSGSVAAPPPPAPTGQYPAGHRGILVVPIRSDPPAPARSRR